MIFSHALEILIPALTKRVSLFTNSGNSIWIETLLFLILSSKLLSTRKGTATKAAIAITVNPNPSVLPWHTMMQPIREAPAATIMATDKR